MTRLLKHLTGEFVTFCIETTRAAEVRPLEMAKTYTEQNWPDLEPHARDMITHRLADACEKAMRSRITAAQALQLELPIPMLDGLPIALATGGGGYISIGAATLVHILSAQAEHRIQIGGHEDSTAKLDQLIADRRRLGVPDDFGFQFWKLGDRTTASLVAA